MEEKSFDYLKALKEPVLVLIGMLVGIFIIFSLMDLVNTDASLDIAVIFIAVVAVFLFPLYVGWTLVARHGASLKQAVLGSIAMGLIFSGLLFLSRIHTYINAPSEALPEGLTLLFELGSAILGSLLLYLPLGALAAIITSQWKKFKSKKEKVI